MLKKRWLIGSVFAALMVFAVTGGVIMAQEDSNSTRTGFAARVASILGLETDTVEDAMEQARTEMFNQQLDANLTAMVESGRITQDQADEYKEWIESRPEGAFGAHDGFGKRGFKRGIGGRDGRMHPWKMKDFDGGDGDDA